MNLKTFKYFYPERPVLIHRSQPLFEELDNDRDWVAERKYNGTRLQLHYIDGQFQFWNRHKEKLSYRPNTELADALDLLPLKGYWLFDGELRDSKTKGVRHKIILYDIFIKANELLIDKPFWFRRELLEKLFTVNAEPLGITEQFDWQFDALFDNVTKDPEIEGLVMKNKRGMVKLGRTSALQSRWMYKVRIESGRYRF